MPPERASAFAPGRVNLIGEHTDYNLGLALPFAIADGIIVHAERLDSGACIEVLAPDLGERDEFAVARPERVAGWRAFARGIVSELDQAGIEPPAALLRISGGVQRGAGLSSSAALEVALCLALLGLARGEEVLDRREIARLCSRAENVWVGAHTGLLDQLASLFGAAETALSIDFRTLEIDPVPLRLGKWRLATLDSGERHVHASSGYNERRAECTRACELLGVDSLRDASYSAVEDLPEPLRRRARHVLGENARVREAVAALYADDLVELARLLSASHASLRDLYEVSTPAVEAARARLLAAGAAGGRLIGGGFGGSVLGLFPPGSDPPPEAKCVWPGAGARMFFD
ncbi:MAG TPA: galactokinase family protein [Solirubrobacteraceae bacterium]|nr:galactokinase family protein [Solirubrobacteraceae bacterium]